MTTGFSVTIDDQSQHISASLSVTGDTVAVAIAGQTYNLHVGGVSTLGLDPTLGSWHQHAVVTDLTPYGLTATDFDTVSTNLAEEPAVFDAFNDLEGEGSIGFAWPVGFVSHWTDASQGIIANQTIWYYPVHVLHPGLVVRFVVTEGDALKLVTLGVGNGFFPDRKQLFRTDSLEIEGLVNCARELG